MDVRHATTFLIPQITEACAVCGMRFAGKAQLHHHRERLHQSGTVALCSQNKENAIVAAVMEVFSTLPWERQQFIGWGCWSAEPRQSTRAFLDLYGHAKHDEAVRHDLHVPLRAVSARERLQEKVHRVVAAGAVGKEMSMMSRLLHNSDHTRQSLMVSSADPLASVHPLCSAEPFCEAEPSGLNATDITPSVCPVSVLVRLPVAESHSLMVVSSDPLASVRPLGLNATEATPSVCPSGRLGLDTAHSE